MLATIDAVLRHLGSDPRPAAGAPTRTSSRELLHRHTVEALGPAPPTDRVRLMVTMPGGAAADGALISELVDAGMDMARINCAHDDPATWEALAVAVRTAAANARHPVQIAFDLAGPKLRTGPLPSGPRVVRLRPRRAVDGTVERPRGSGSSYRALLSRHRLASHRSFRLTAPCWTGRRPVTRSMLRDSRGRRRRLDITTVHDRAIEATSDRTAYLATGTPLERRRAGELVGRGHVGGLPPASSFIRLERGDRLRVRLGDAPGSAAVVADDGSIGTPATISCDLEDVFRAVAVGDRMLFDDGAIETVVERVTHDELEVIVQRPESAKLKAEKGINLPDTTLSSPALTTLDRQALAVIAPHADLISLSYVGPVDDLLDLRRALDGLGRPDVAIGLKIERAAAFAELPRLLLGALERLPVAVMIARGDLAIEIGYERLAEVQEEILWLCEAAHIPVIWATQVAESLAKDGVPTRAEVTDAAWASRAECVMLNKGPHIADAVRFVDDVVARMHEHQDKNTSLLRRLAIATALDDDGCEPGST